MPYQQLSVEMIPEYFSGLPEMKKIFSNFK
ncbi:uncharacterized protein METZ01_LOCUS342847, partial [marine metagenome]